MSEPQKNEIEPILIPIEHIIGAERHQAIPVPAHYLEDYELILSDEKIDVPINTLHVGHQMVRIMKEQAGIFGAELEGMSPARLPAIQKEVYKTLVNSFLQQSAYTGNPLIFVEGEFLMPVETDGIPMLEIAQDNGDEPEGCDSEAIK